MENDQATIQWLNLVHMSPTFVVRVGTKNAKPTVQSPKIIPSGDGEYWVAGSTKLKCGTELDSVFIVDTDADGALLGVYWRIADQWWDFQNRPGVFEAIGACESEVFPFDWSYSIPLESDLYHS